MVKYRERKGVELNGERKENKNPQMSNYQRVISKWNNNNNKNNSCSKCFWKLLFLKIVNEKIIKGNANCKNFVSSIGLLK